jgi:hypothetical protein
MRNQRRAVSSLLWAAPGEVACHFRGGHPLQQSVFWFLILVPLVGLRGLLWSFVGHIHACQPLGVSHGRFAAAWMRFILTISATGLSSSPAVLLFFVECHLLLRRRWFAGVLLIWPLSVASALRRVSCLAVWVSLFGSHYFLLVVLFVWWLPARRRRLCGVRPFSGSI